MDKNVTKTAKIRERRRTFPLSLLKIFNLYTDEKTSVCAKVVIFLKIAKETSFGLLA